MPLEKNINSADIIGKLELEDDRVKQSLYLSKRIFTKFRKACGRASPSRVVEELMKIFIKDAEEGPKRKVNKSSNT